ncbi:MAG: TIM barrel protein [Planctomycetaceae bacterium]|nr:TIM barrel protein [Planctomycetaceae bacterium]
MERRSVLLGGLALGTAAMARAQEAAPAASSFQLAYAPHFGTFAQVAGDDPIAQLEWARERGFTAWEDNGMAGRSVEEQTKIARAMERLGIRMGVFVANFGTAFGKRSFATASEEHMESFLRDLANSVEVAKRVNATWMTIVLGDRDPRVELDFQHSRAIEMLKRGAEVFEPHGLVMVMEPLNPWRDHPGMLLAKAAQAHMLCKAVGSPAVKILFDIYHQQIAEGNLIPNIDRAWDEIAYFQIGDNPGRNEPGTGEIHYGNVFRHIHGRGFTGILGMEHGNSQGGVEGDLKVLEAYRAADACIAR